MDAGEKKRIPHIHGVRCLAVWFVVWAESLWRWFLAGGVRGLQVRGW